VLDQGERDRAPGLLGEPDHPLHLALGSREVLTHHPRRRELEHAGPRVGEGPAEGEQLVLGGERARHRLAVDRPVRDGA